jgi:ectoine hydroxylase-related dioxygenase (phytanoyl-CoA dioxygenase family)
MQTSPGAGGQDLHKDVHHLDRHGAFDCMPESWNCSINGYPRCISIQLQLTDTTQGKMGSLEVLPGSHRPDTDNGSPSIICRAVKDPCIENGVIPVDVGPGTVTIYSSRLWHRGGPNESRGDRKFCFFTATEQDVERAPPGLVHTMQMDDVGKWCIQGRAGLSAK